MNIPGFTYPVTEYFLSDLQKMIGYSAERKPIEQPWSQGNIPSKKLKLLQKVSQWYSSS